MLRPSAAPKVESPPDGEMHRKCGEFLETWLLPLGRNLFAFRVPEFPESDRLSTQTFHTSAYEHTAYVYVNK